MSQRFDKNGNVVGIGNRFDGKRFYLTTLYPRIYPKLDDIVIVANETDRCDTIAQKFYKDSELWWIIAKANQLGKGSLDIPPGTYIRIPQDTSYIISLFNSINSS